MLLLRHIYYKYATPTRPPIRHGQPETESLEMKRHDTLEPRLRVGFLLSNKFTLTAFASFVDVLRLSGDEGDRSRQILCKWKILAPRLKPIVSSCGVSLFPSTTLSDPKEFDYIVVIGGLLDETNELEPESISYLKSAADAKIPLIGLCTGGFILHRADLMKGYRCCVSWFHHEDFLRQFKGLEPVSDQIYVIDRDRLTCSGGTSSAHLAAYLVEKHIGPAQAHKSLRIMIISDARTGDRPQPGVSLKLDSDDNLVQRALNIMQQNMANPLSIEAIAKRLEVAKRTLERRFKATLGMSPSEADKQIRIGYAKQLMNQSKHSIAQIALDVGFCNASHFLKVFREQNGLTPSAYRTLNKD